MPVTDAEPAAEKRLAALHEQMIAAAGRPLERRRSRPPPTPTLTTTASKSSTC